MPACRVTRSRQHSSRATVTIPLRYMTRGKKAQEGVPEGKDSKERCIWTVDDESWLIQYITTHHAKGGEGMNFDKTFWAAAATAMAEHATRPPLKTADACQSKWAQICSTFNVVNRVANYSGMEFSLECGANITDGSEPVWTEILKSIPQAKQFKNKGWVHYDALKDLLPSKGRGDTAHYASVWPTATKDCNKSESGLSAATSSCTSTAFNMGRGPGGSTTSFELELEALDGLGSEHPSGGQKPNDSDVSMGPPPSPFDAARQLQMSSSTFSTLASSSIGKRKADGDDDSLRNLARPPNSTKSPSATSTSGKTKSQCVTLLQAFQNMTSEIHVLGSSFDHTAAALQERTLQMQEHALQTAAHLVDPVPLRKNRAIMRVQQEEGLSNTQVVAIITHIQGDVTIADTYLAIEKDDIRRMYLSKYFE